jgi:hypothetical protein
VFVPVFPPDAVPAALAEPGVWHRFERLRNRVEANGDDLPAIREVFGRLEAELWVEADAVGNVAAQQAVVEGA